MKNIKKITGILLVTVLLLAQAMMGAPLLTHAATGQNTATVSVEKKDGTAIIDKATATLKKDENAFSILKKITNQKGIKLKYQTSSKYGAYIQGIGGVVPKSPSYWGFFINGKSAQVGVSSYKVQPGDHLLFKVVTAQPQTVKVSLSAKGKNGKMIIPKTAVSVKPGATAFKVLKKITKKQGIQLNAPVSDKYGAYVKGIGGIVPKTPAYWGFFINGKSAQVGVSSYKVKAGDRLSFKVVTSAYQGSSGSTAGSSDQPKVTKKKISNALNRALQIVIKNGVDTAWEAVGVRKAGKTVPKSYLDQVKKKLKKNNGTFHNVTDYERLALGVTAAGGNATNIAGYNLIKKIYTSNSMTKQGTNGVIYGLIALDSGHYQVPKGAKWTRTKLVNYLLKKQLKDGGWGLNGSQADVDITAMVLTALAPYKNQSNVQSASQKAVDWLSEHQNQNGGFTTSTGTTSESISAVITALSALGEDASGKSFTKSGHDLFSKLMSYHQSNGGFAHVKKGEANAISTEQALIALDAYRDYSNGKGSVYQFPSPETNSKQTVNPYIWIGAAVLLAIIIASLVYWRRKKVQH